MIRGMAKFRNWPKKALKVAKILLTDSGKKSPKTTPKTMAINTLNNKLENRLFIFMLELLWNKTRSLVDFKIAKIAGKYPEPDLGSNKMNLLDLLNLT